MRPRIERTRAPLIGCSGMHRVVALLSLCGLASTMGIHKAVPSSPQTVISQPPRTHLHFHSLKNPKIFTAPLFVADESVRQQLLRRGIPPSSLPTTQTQISTYHTHEPGALHPFFHSSERRLKVNCWRGQVPVQPPQFQLRLLLKISPNVSSPNTR